MSTYSPIPEPPNNRGPQFQPTQYYERDRYGRWVPVVVTRRRPPGSKGPGYYIGMTIALCFAIPTLLLVFFAIIGFILM